MLRSLRAFAFAALALLPGACANLNLFSEEEENALGVQAYAELTGQHPTITSGPEYEMVQRVGQRIAAASEKDFEWEFKLLKADDVPNAFCLPGGKVAIYTGILPVTQNEHGLAAVMGHEVAHATLRHGGKRMTQEAIFGIALEAANAGLELAEMSEDGRSLVLAAFGIGAQIGLLLPYSRGHETEADEIGLRYAIRAGYDPWEAPKLWERMEQLGGESPPEWLSTHPDSGSRAANLRAMIPRFVEEERGWRPRARAQPK
jgi:predicted Zn-dependent protease